MRTFQAEDEIAAVGAAIGATYGGAIGVTGTSGPGVALKSESISLAVPDEYTGDQAVDRLHIAIFSPIRPAGHRPWRHTHTISHHLAPPRTTSLMTCGAGPVILRSLRFSERQCILTL